MMDVADSQGVQGRRCRWPLRVDVPGRESGRRRGKPPATAEAAERRCARYDQAPPKLPKPARRPAILVFDKINGFRDEPSVNAARKALTDMAARRGWSLTFTDKGAVFNP